MVANREPWRYGHGSPDATTTRETTMQHVKALNGIGPAGKGARQLATERAMREARQFASAAREIARLRKAGK